MSELSASSGADSKRYLYLPTWVKWSVLLVAGVILSMSAWSVFRALSSSGGGDSVVFFVSVAQSAALVIVFFLLVLFSRRDANSHQLLALSARFLDKYVVDALSKVTIPPASLLVSRPQEEDHSSSISAAVKSFAQAGSSGAFAVTIDGEEGNDIFGRRLWMQSTTNDFRFPLWVGVNVKRLFVIYFIPLTETQQVSDLESIFQYTFGGARDVGYKVNFEEASMRGERFVSIWMTVHVGDEFLTDPNEKLFWAQDIAMMTESLLRTAMRNGISLQLRSIEPAPL